MPWQFSFKKIMLFCSKYAENYASTIRQGLFMSSSSTIVWVNVVLMVLNSGYRSDWLTNQVNNQSLIKSNDVIQLTLTLKMTTAQVVEK